MRTWTNDNPGRVVNIGSVTITERYDLVMAAHSSPIPSGGLEPGWQVNTDAGLDIRSIGPFSPGGFNIAPFFTANSTTQPLTAAAHELGHALTAPHIQEPNPGACNNPSKPEPWPTDCSGRLQGTKFHWRLNSPIDPVVDGMGGTSSTSCRTARRTPTRCRRAPTATPGCRPAIGTAHCPR